MEISFKELSKYLQTSYNLDEIIKALDKIGLEVEQVTNYKHIYKPFIIAKIEKIEPHPNADKLNICYVDTGNLKLQIVCGATNAREGIKVVLATIGTKIPLNDLIIKKATLRGVESFGMLCSAKELNIHTSTDEDGIMELNDSAIIGDNFCEYAKLDDVIIKLSITPNKRQSCASVYGIARELAAFGMGNLLTKEISNIDYSFKNDLIIEILDNENCYEFNLFKVKNLKLYNHTFKEFSIKKNVLPILVQISNFAMLEMGRPNHFYDALKVKGKIIVRKSEDGEEFIALGGIKYLLPSNLTVIADEEKILSIAGVIGGELSKVDEYTQQLIIEVANFNPKAVSLAGQKLNIFTDARFRFEGRIDGENSDYFINYLISLIKNYYNCEFSNVISLKGSNPNHISSLKFNLNKIEKILGFKIEKNQVIKILNNLSFKVQECDEYLVLSIPSFKIGEIKCEENVLEEILRMYGIDNIPKTSHFSMVNDHIDTNKFSYKLSTSIKDNFIYRNFNEVITWPFYSKETAFDYKLSEGIYINNPLNKEFAILRESIIPNLLQVIKKNEFYNYKNLSFFEIGNIYSKKYIKYEHLCLAGIRYGLDREENPLIKAKPYNVYHARDDLFSLLKILNFDLKEIEYKAGAPIYYHPKRSGKIVWQEHILGYFGEINPILLHKYDLYELPVIAFECFAKAVESLGKKIEIEQLQPLFRDLSIVIDDQINCIEIIKNIQNIANDYIKDVSIFDIYQIEKHTKAIGIRIKIQPKNLNLTTKDINIIVETIMHSLANKFNAKLRTQNMVENRIR